MKTRMKSKIVLTRYKYDLSEKEKILIRKTELLLDNTEMIKNMKKEGFSKSIFALSNKLNVKTFIFQNKEESDYEK